MRIWIVEFMPAVGDFVFDSAWSTEEKARAYLDAKKEPGQWNMFETTVDKEEK